MEPNVTALLLGLVYIPGTVLGLFALYYLVVALFGFKKRKAAPLATPQTRFAIVVAARNEAAVIGQLVDSLKAQHYPKHLYDIIVAPNNCTDNTAAVARSHGAQIFEPVGLIRSKGEVLAQLTRSLLRENRHDALVVFDADNLVQPDFLRAMNNARVAGAQVAQGFRDSKNLADSGVSTCYSIGYWMMNRFYNGGRQVLGLSAQISGSGFMVGLPLLRQMGGWSTRTMTEDYEFTAQCVLAGQRVWYVPEAVLFDEQPLTFRQSWKQRRRWATGSVEGMELYLPRLLRTAVHRRDAACLDLALTFATPAVQLASLILGTISTAVTVWQVIGLNIFTLAQGLTIGASMLAAAYMLFVFLAAAAVQLFRPGRTAGTGRGVAMFAVFALSQSLIGIISLFKRTTTWDAIPHTRAVGIGDMAA